MTELGLLAPDGVDEGVVSKVIRPAAVIPEEAAHAVLMQLSLNDVRAGGVWEVEPSTWRRFDSPREDTTSEVDLIGSIHVAYGVPTRYEITIFRATVTAYGTSRGRTVEDLCDEALAYGGLTLATCPRADLKPPPRPFRFR